jgi:hypothetical protein
MKTFIYSLSILAVIFTISIMATNVGESNISTNCKQCVRVFYQGNVVSNATVVMYSNGSYVGTCNTQIPNTCGFGTDAACSIVVPTGSSCTAKVSWFQGVNEYSATVNFTACVTPQLDVTVQ